MSDMPRLAETSDTWTQEPDCCDPNLNGIQELMVRTEDGGGGPYLVIKTDRWAIDDIEQFSLMIRATLLRSEKMGISLIDKKEKND